MQRKRDMHQVKKPILVTGDVVSGATVARPQEQPQEKPENTEDSDKDSVEN
jgi:hypothetical protein